MKHTTSILAFVVLTMTLPACVLQSPAAADSYQPNIPNNGPSTGAALAGDAFAHAAYCQTNPAGCSSAPMPVATPTATPTPALDENFARATWTLQTGTLVSDQCFGECSVADGNEQGVVITVEPAGIRRTGYQAGDAIPFFAADGKTLEWHEQRDAGTTCAGPIANVTFTAELNGGVLKSVYKEGHCQLAPRRCLCVYAF